MKRALGHCVYRGHRGTAGNPTLDIVFSALVSCQLCVLEERPDPSQGGALRWSLPYKERCYCQGVVAPRKSTQTCTTYKDRSGDKKLWFVDDPTPLTNRMNWNKEALDILLEREEYCDPTCPLPKVVKTDQGKATAMVWWLDPVPTDSTDYVYKATCYPPSGTNFTIGISQVVCKAVDRRGITKTCNFDIKVEDNQAPVLASCPAIEPKNTDPGEVTALITWEGPVAIDNSGGIPTVTCYPPSGTNFTIGHTPVTCTAVDISGNQESCIFYVDVIDNCLRQLGMEDKRIENGQITASSVWHSELGQGYFSPLNARLNQQETFEVNAGSWCAAKNDDKPWIQVNLLAIKWVSGVMIQGRNGYDQWVTKFKVVYNIYGSKWKHVKTADDQEDLVFDGNTDRDTIVPRLFPSHVRATVIRIQPIQWHNHISIRFDLIGCDDPEWQLVFKAVSGIASATMYSDGFDEYDPYKVWERNEPNNEDIPQAHQLKTNFSGHYKSSFALDWETRNIDKVMVVLVDYTGMELMTLLFNGTGSNSFDWFSKDRLFSSSYDDIYSEPQNYFAVKGHANVGRHWFINRKYFSCPEDTGWMVVSYDFTPACDWERNRPNVLPVFLYSLTNNYTKWNIAKDNKPLGLATGLVKDSQLTTSSYYQDNTHTRSPKFGRLDNSNSWAALTNENGEYHWLQVDFLSAVGMKGIQTQGAELVQQWVTKLSIKTGDDENSLAPIMESGIDKIFTANSNANDIVDIEFPVTIFARLLRVIPVAWHEWLAMRMEVMGYYTDVGEASIFTIFVHTPAN
ncbi:uncharacterized protein [Amphiura filiformis]|uniref:uncharacterized protein n=1 Tax=Amphiura filiformis TaxID=82378 RepID=UPI003B21A52A